MIDAYTCRPVVYLGGGHWTWSNVHPLPGGQ